MKIKYLDGKRFHAGLIAGGRAVIKSRNYLNKINVFPVADADTGTNMAATMQAILDRSKIGKTLHDTLSSVSDSALTGARGNSGIIFAQYLHSLSSELPKKGQITVKKFAESAQTAVKHLYDSLMNPREGTMLTVIREWADDLEKRSHKTTDFMHLLTESLDTARASLKDTPNKLKALAEAGVVDAGASGFVEFLEGIVEFIHKGSLKGHHVQPVEDIDIEEIDDHTEKPGEFRYCNEAIITKCKLTVKELKERLSPYGDSLIVAGDQAKIHLHIHSNEPEKLFGELQEIGKVSGSKVDDMARQYEIVHERANKIGLITDSTSDIPGELVDKYQISQLPLGINFGDKEYLDKKTIKPEKFYSMIRTEPIHPESAQPTPKMIKTLFDFTSSHYDDVIVLSVSEFLSGTYNSMKQIAANMENTNIHIVDTRQISASHGLITMRVAEAIEQGLSVEEILEKLSKWIEDTELYTDIQTLKYMVKSGRVKPFAGFVASMLNLKPLVILDNTGKANLIGKSIIRKQNMDRTINMIKEKLKYKKLYNYCIVHAENLPRAKQYAELLTTITGKRPAYIMPISPVVGVHNGVGVVGIGIMYD